VGFADRVLELVEATFGCECELFVEFTGLLSWQPGSSIEWHHDANRDYLEVRLNALCFFASLQQQAGAVHGERHRMVRDASMAGLSVG
jgi:hypothetical protein